MARKTASVATEPSIRVTVGRTDYELQPTLAAARKLGQSTGGLRAALTKVQDIDIDAMAAVIIAGSGLRLTSDAVDDLMEAVFRCDKPTLAGDLIGYLLTMLQGGEPERPEAGRAKAEAGDGDTAPLA